MCDMLSIDRPRSIGAYIAERSAVDAIKDSGGGTDMSVYKGYTEKGKIAANKYKKDHRDRILIEIPKGKKEEYRAKAESKGLSLTAYIVSLIENDK